MVINEDARLLTEAVRDRQLQILNLPGADALARRLPSRALGASPPASTIWCVSSQVKTSVYSASTRCSLAIAVHAGRSASPPYR